MLTKKGAIVMLVAGAALAGGLFTGRTAIVGVGIVLVAYLSVGLFYAPRAGLSATLAISHDRLREGDPVEVKATITAGRARTGLAEVHVVLPRVTKIREGDPVDLVALSPGSSHELSFTMEVAARGIYPVGPVEVRARDPFGLYAREWQPAGSTSLTVYPRWRSPKDLPIRGKTPRIIAGRYIVHQPGDGTDFFGLRDYLPGDALRQVNWKATARSKEMVVNQWEKESVTETTIFVDHRRVTGLGSEVEHPLLHIARLAATLTSYFMSSRDRVRVVMYGDKVHTHRGGRGEGHFHNILADLAGTRPIGNVPLGHAVDLALPHISERSPVIILTVGMGDPTIRATVARLRAQDNPVLVLAPTPRLGDGPGARTLRAAFDHALGEARAMGAITYEVADQEDALNRIMQEVIA